MNKWKRRILIVLFSLGLNILGRFFAFSYELPAYLNLCGTILVSYSEGAVFGGITAILSCALSSVFSPSDWYFLIADIFVAVATGLVSKRNRFFSKFSLIISATAFLAVIRTVILVLINVSVYGGKIDLYIASAIVDYLTSMSVPAWICYTSCAACISFVDSFVGVFVIFITLSIRRNFGKKRRASELKKQLHAVTLSALIAAIVFSNAFGYT